ncbi:MAG: prolipoprotein diacylglyceryl transferase [Candidatus Omnitrophota bacterium]|jgi:phosphatidylglycerol:prolipoprotein diacylglycerol transferase
MHPEICRIGPLVVYSYGLMLVIAFTCAVSLASAEAKRQNIDPEVIFNVCFLAFIFGIIGGRVLYVLEHFKDYLGNPFEMIMIQHGGLSWFGGLIFGVLSGLIYLRIKKLPVLKILDIVAPYIALAQSIGRVGCYFNGCCYGSTPYLPTQIYSSLLLLIIFLLLRYVQLRPHREGQIIVLYLILYSVKRFFIEFWRIEHGPVLFGLTLFQLISIAVFIAALLIQRALKIKK